MTDHTLNQAALEELVNTIEGDIATKQYDGAVVLVAQHGNIALHRAIGHSDLANGRKTRLDDVFHLMSITKQMTTVVVLQAIERGQFSLDTKIAEIIPEFGIKGKNNITVYHLLTHMSGMNEELPAALKPGEHINIKALVAAVSDERLQRRPGSVVCYNPYAAHAILAEMICRQDREQRPFRKILNDELFQPLAMHDSSLCLRPEIAERRVPIVARFGDGGLFEPEAFNAMNLLATEEAEFAAAGAMGTAMDVFRFTEMLRRGGELDGCRILSQAMVADATRNHTGQQSNDIFDWAREIHNWPDWPAYIGLTFFLRGEGIFPTHMGHNTSPGTFCGEGAGSTLFWVDTERDLSFIFLSAGIMDEAENILRCQKLSDIVVSAAA
jgi:CubicO group peptidase (beta-lactamase class C family)